MKGRFCCVIFCLLQIASWVTFATSRALTSTTTDNHHLLPPTTAPLPGSGLSPEQSLPVSSTTIKGGRSMNGGSEEEVEEEYYNRGGMMGKIGSTPPSCEHKCYQCTPCEAIQVPTITKRHDPQLRLQYTNYEPEGWKCKCGPTFYSP